MEIAKNIKYIGVDDTDIDLFEGQYDVPEGISYNSYLIDDEKIAVMDTVDARKTNEWVEKLETALNGRTPDYLIIHHMEPDHASNVRMILEKYPDCIGICSQKAVAMVKRFFDVDFGERLKAVKEGDTLPLGQHTLTFIMAPMVHWPEVMMSYEQTEGILFAADGFGKFGALSHPDSEGMAADKLHATVEGWACEARRYYFNIVGKYGAMVQTVLKKAAKLDIKTIAPLHGPVLNENLDYYLNLYNTWSSYEPEDEGIFIAYCSLHGNTEEAALKLADIIKDNSDVKVSTSDLARDDMAEAIEDAFRYDRLVVAAPTYDGGIMPIMQDFIHHLSIKAYQNRTVGIIENGSWAPASGKKMHEAFEQMKNITLIEPIVTVESTVKQKTVADLKALAEKLIY
ncbi:MAG: FprA family A-type flavoprotein [Bacteroidaceae bacterium]|nr:FprA family A-type flavoprotein [Bacteroidaceae bacterium]